jgi:hypothetical protein
MPVVIKLQPQLASHTDHDGSGMRVSQIAAHLEKMSGEMREFAATHNGSSHNRAAIHHEFLDRVFYINIAHKKGAVVAKTIFVCRWDM